MYIAIEHDIHDATAFQRNAERVFPLPEDLVVHHFLPSADFSRANCLYEGPSVETVRDYLEPILGEASTQRYFAVAEGAALGLPVATGA